MKEIRNAGDAAAPLRSEARFAVGDVVGHRLFPFRGVVFDVDPEFANTEEWLESIPEAVRPEREQPFYHLLAENDENSYVAYVSQQNLEHDDTDLPIQHPAIPQLFNAFGHGPFINTGERRVGTECVSTVRLWWGPEP